MGKDWRQIPSLGDVSVRMRLGAKSQNTNGLIREDT